MDLSEFAPNISTRLLDRNPIHDPNPARGRRYRIELRSTESRSRLVRSTAFSPSDSISLRIAARLDSRCSCLTVRIDAKSTSSLGDTHTPDPIRTRDPTIYVGKHFSELQRRRPVVPGILDLAGQPLLPRTWTNGVAGNGSGLLWEAWSLWAGILPPHIRFPNFIFYLRVDPSTT